MIERFIYFNHEFLQVLNVNSFSSFLLSSSSNEALSKFSVGYDVLVYEPVNFFISSSSAKHPNEGAVPEL